MATDSRVQRDGHAPSLVLQRDEGFEDLLIDDPDIASRAEEARDLRKRPERHAEESRELSRPTSGHTLSDVAAGGQSGATNLRREPITLFPRPLRGRSVDGNPQLMAGLLRNQAFVGGH